MYDDYQTSQNISAARGLAYGNGVAVNADVTSDNWKEEAKKLRLVILDINDRFAKTIRTYEDILYNLDDDNFSTVLKKEKDNMKAEIKINHDMISLEVIRSLEEDVYMLGRIVIEADRITQEVVRSMGAEGLLSGRITVEADRITSEVLRATEAEGTLYSRITQTAEEIRLEVSNANQGMESKITQNANAIALEVNRAIGAEATLSSNLLIEAGRITAEVNARITGQADLQSRITQTATEISMKVSQTDYNGTTIASLINQSATSILIAAEKINLYGYATFNSLSGSGTSVINGGNITTNSITADKIRLDTLYVNKLAQYGYENSNFIDVIGSMFRFYYGGREFLTIYDSQGTAVFSLGGIGRMSLNSNGGSLTGSWTLNGRAIATI